MSNYIVGLTGGIGSGKSVVSNRFEALGITVADTDIASRAIVEPGMPALAEVRAHFGEGILGADGTLDRAALRARVFAQPEERKWLESTLNPRIGQWTLERIRNSPGAYAILVNPVLVETGQYRLCQRVLVVDVSEQLQIERASERDGNTPEQIRAIMRAQGNREARLAAADDVIINDTGLDHLDAEVQRLHRLYLELARGADRPLTDT
ncbi:MAG: dephospho-CoA kinase [Pseudomonadales bacterium]|jgi:dephospho-CoA kinase|nr:dephospho-CoA kinase [Pseudomonadales bacterium]MDP6470891.1 dephospho-CoA kinase [Pseudomonadales bacterium]MDP6825924.1 dephospho-CoA kinase [Pseudomonadales bacterium]MDP6972236.1 dephospho-CoA kinase [Pseudomonadales bacterium]|tara:strand:- start:433 stop:1059 length:627 start_codon:yes stop_codon:yes gene_type:complete